MTNKHGIWEYACSPTLKVVSSHKNDLGSRTQAVQGWMQRGCPLSSPGWRLKRGPLCVSRRDRRSPNVTQLYRPSQEGIIMTSKPLTGQSPRHPMAASMLPDGSWEEDGGPARNTSLNSLSLYLLLRSLLGDVFRERLRSAVMTEHRTTSPTVLCFWLSNMMQTV